MWIHADPGTGQSQKVKNILKVSNTIGQKHIYEGTKAFFERQETRSIVNFG
jgi:hypothetical protein